MSDKKRINHFKPGNNQVKYQDGDYFTVVPNHLIKTIPMKNADMFLVWTYLQSMRNDWQPKAFQIMKHFGFKRTKYNKIMSWLLKSKLIRYEQERKPDGSYGETYLIVLDGRDYCDTDAKLVEEQPVVANTASRKHGIPQKRLHNKDQYTNHDQETNTLCETDVPRLSSAQKSTKQMELEIVELFIYWQVIYNKPKTKLLKGRHKTLKWALTNYTLDECKLAIDGNKLDKHNMNLPGGHNKSGKVYVELKTIFRDEEQIERLINQSSDSSNNDNEMPQYIIDEIRAANYA